jgi:dCTP deaminase
MGLSFLNATKIHSGFVGRLALELVNLSNDRQPITIRKGDPLMHIEFMTREGAPSPYDGEYQFQYMSSEEADMYVDLMSGSFKELFDRKDLEKRAASRVSELIHNE